MTARPEGIAPPKGPKDDELIERLTKLSANYNLSGDLAAKLTQAASRIAELKAALTPFAHYADLNDLLTSRDPDRVIEVPVRDLVAAYRALSNPPSGEVSQ